MNKFGYNDDIFQGILKMQQEELKEYLANALKEYGYNPISNKGYLYAKGNIPVLLVAHLDTVHTEIPSIICFSDGRQYLMSPQGIGGDDRCGVYMILLILTSLKCHVLFCEDEETGGNGARDFANSKIKPEVNYIIEMDRRGSNDAVFYNCDNPEFTEFVISYGFKKERGSFSDISVIGPYLETAAVNISAGYYNEHRLHEYIDLSALYNNVRRITQMIKTPTEHFEYIEKQNNFSLLSAIGRSRFNDTFDISERKNKLLMALPKNTRLITNGFELHIQSNYLIDRESNVYIYLEELNAAVESEHSYACDKNGKQIYFSSFEAKRLPVLSMETALEQLSMIN